MTRDWDLLRELAEIPWDRIARTYGNCHSTLIGAVVQQWTSREDRFALEAGCSGGYRRHNKGTRVCDAVLCTNSGGHLTPQGILEVEGNPLPKAKDGSPLPNTIFKRMATYWAHVAVDAGQPEALAVQKKYFAALRFGILVAYDYGYNRQGIYGACATERQREQLLEGAAAFAREVKVNMFVVMIQKKAVIRKTLHKDDIRRINQYYPCVISQVTGVQMGPCGTEQARQEFYRHSTDNAQSLSDATSGRC